MYKARCRVLKRWVAVKILKDEFVNDEEFLERFERYMPWEAGIIRT